MTNGADHDVIVKLEERVESMNKRLERFYTKFDKMDTKIDKILKGCAFQKKDCTKSFISKSTFFWTITGVCAFGGFVITILHKI